MRKVKSMSLTILCMAVILGIGYLVIMESGRNILENGIMLEETDYEGASLNIFYGKIEEDIELFPWNYYPGDEAEAGWESADGIHPFFQYTVLAGNGEDLVEEELKSLQSWYLCQMIADQAGSEPSEVWSLFDKRQHTLMDEIRMVENSPVGPIFFYQDTLPIGKKQYQVRIAFTQWNIISFICIEDREAIPSDSQAAAKGQTPGMGQQAANRAGARGGNQASDKRGGSKESRQKWEEGKNKLVKILEGSEGQMAEYFAYMSFLRDWDYTVFYVGDKYVNCHLKSLQWLEQIWEGDREKDEELSVILKEMEEIETTENGAVDVYGISDDKAKEKDTDSESEDMEISEVVGIPEAGDTEVSVEPIGEPDPSFSYQIVELKDMILLLMQGESTIGIYYDPVTQEFCGYNYFYEY